MYVRRRWLPAFVVIAGVWLAGCSESHDAWFANPCDEPLVIRTFYAAAGADGPASAEDLIAEATLAANAVTKVEDAFQDAAGSTWFVEVDGAETFSVTTDEMPRWFVSLPADACDG